MFSLHLSFCSQGQEGVSLQTETPLDWPPPPDRETHWTETSRTDRDTPVLTSSGGHRSGRYASYWNANVFQMYLDTCVSFLYFNVQYLGITQCFDDTVTILWNNWYSTRRLEYKIRFLFSEKTARDNGRNVGRFQLPRNRTSFQLVSKEHLMYSDKSARQDYLMCTYRFHGYWHRCRSRLSKALVVKTISCTMIWRHESESRSRHWTSLYVYI